MDRLNDIKSFIIALMYICSAGYAELKHRSLVGPLPTKTVLLGDLPCSQLPNS